MAAMLDIFNETLSRLVEAAVVAVVAWTFRLSRRVQVLETQEHVRAAQAALQNQVTQEKVDHFDERLETALTMLSQMSKLMERIETLQETSLKRLDILEKHVFKL